MFENNNTQKRIMKRNMLMSQIKEAEENNILWKKNQLEIKLYNINTKHYPSVFWDSSKKGTYKKRNEASA